jgi:hypothetical protein
MGNREAGHFCQVSTSSLQADALLFPDGIDHPSAIMAYYEPVLLAEKLKYRKSTYNFTNILLLVFLRIFVFLHTYISWQKAEWIYSSVIGF